MHMLGEWVRVTMDRPMGSAHPAHPDIVYGVNYGYVEGVMGGDGEPQDAYVLGVDGPLDAFNGRVVGIIHRLDDVEDKWVVAPDGVRFTEAEIREMTRFQEQYFSLEIEVLPREPIGEIFINANQGLEQSAAQSL